MVNGATSSPPPPRSCPLAADHHRVRERVDTWQLVINTAASVLAFLLVALLQNSERRSDRAASRKLDGITAALADLLAAPLDGIDRETLARRISELRATINVRRADLSRLAPRPPSARAFHLCTTKRARHRRGRGTVAGHRGQQFGRCRLRQLLLRDRGALRSAAGRSSHRG